MIEGPISQDKEYIELSTGQIFTVLSANDDDGSPTETVLDVLGVELPCVVYYSTTQVEKTIVVAESAFRERFEAK